MTDRSRVEEPREPIAIIGIGCHFPGGATNPTAFWQLLCSGTDATREIPDDRWDTGKFYDPDGGKLGKMSTTRGGFLDRVDEFDAHFFGISPREAVWLDPQQRLLLRTTWEALEDAGQAAERLAGSDTGVFIGGFTLDYKLLQNYGVQSRYELQSHSATGMMMTMLANRLSYSFDFRGPSLAVDTACSGSLVAVHLAAQSIWNGECSLALAGGANVMIAPNMTIAESKGGFLAPDGRCKAFDASANGYARGEGAGVVLLKPLARALADGDPVYALIRGTAVTQDGHSNGITVPNRDAQETAMRTAYRRAGIAPGDVQYVEAHGTGTPVGDPVEANAIGRVLSEGRPAGRDLIIGSVKTNIGHLEAAAGVAGLIKTALALRHGRIPGQLHFREPNPGIPFGELRLRVQTDPGEWPQSTGPRYAGVNSFGFGGTNAHVVLENPPAPAPRPGIPPAAGEPRRRLVPLSARAPEALAAMAAATGELLAGDGGPELADVGYTRALRRSHLEHRLAVVAATGAEAAGKLAGFAEGRTAKDVPSGRVPTDGRLKVAFVCSGMGPQWWAMARQLLETEPLFLATVQRCDRELARYTGWSLLAELLASEEESRMAATEVAQPANFAVQVGLAELWRSWGVEPDGVIGHSTGEVAAQYLAGVLGFEDAVKVVHHRSSLQQRATGQGRMLAVGMTPETLDKAVNDAGPLVSIAAINSPTAVTLAGDTAVLENMAAQLETFGVFHRFLRVEVPYHSHYMDPLRKDLEEALAGLAPSTATLPLYSTVTGSLTDGRAADARYWWQNVRATVLFAPAFRQMIADGFTHFVEIGPHPVLAGAMTELLAEQQAEGVVVPSLRRDEPDDAVLLRSLGTLYSHGQDVRWEALHGEGARQVPLPPYPWQLKRYWNESTEAREDRHYAQTHPLLGQRLNAAHPTWEREITTRLLPYLADHRVQGTTLLPGAAFVEQAIAAAREVYGEGGYTVENLELRKALVLGAATDPRLRTILDRQSGRVEFTSFTASPGGERTWTLNATARLSRRASARTRRDLDHERDRCLREVSREEFYERTRRMGFAYGPAFQAVQGVSTGPGLAVGRVTVPRTVRGDLEAYHFHPSLLDAAFQILLTAATEPEADGGRPARTYLPVGLDSITVLDSPTGDLCVVAETRSVDARAIISDITVCDTRGEVLAEVRGFHAQSLDTVAGVSPEHIDRGLYRLSWPRTPCEAISPDRPAREQPVQEEHEGREVDVPTGLWLVFTGPSGIGGEVVRRLRESGRTVVTVGCGQVSEPVETGPGSHLIDPLEPTHYEQLLRTLAGRSVIDRVVHLWSSDTDFGEDGTAAALEAAQDRGTLSVLHLTQALIALGTHPAPRLWLVTRTAQSVDGAPRPLALAQSPLWGLARVIGHQEAGSVWGGIVDLDTGPDAEEAAHLLEEITGPGDEDQIAYRDGVRHAARLVPATDLAPPFPVRMRADGAYLVTGGFGALGLLVAEFLAERGARRLVLMGRTPVPPRADWHRVSSDHPRYALVRRLLALESRGVEIECAAVDAADEEQLRAWYEEHRRRRLAPVRGVVHTAGVVADALVPRMDREAFRRVLRPKLTGGWLLHRLFADTVLDFFVLFGSTGSVIASPGQSNYASANAFLDALAEHRRSLGLPALTIGWGPWSVGMVEQLGLEEVYRRRGIELITPETGTRILGRLLDQRPAQVVAITADWTAVRAAAGRMPPMFAGLGAADSEAAGEDDRAGAEATLTALRRAPEAERHSLLAAHVHAIAALVLNLDPGDFGDQDDLGALGLDSMMAIETKQRIDATLRVELPVLDLLQGITVSDLADRLLPLLVPEESIGAGEPGGPPGPTAPAEPDPAQPPQRELEALLARISPDELEKLLNELEDEPTEARNHDPVA
ncbi:type I polyketide synthase [Streptomyces calidiresistens]|uniref:Acyltransferase domain-containing protein n=1 Tax=Streptomyces calidiresistens TaxID=1485586 RepID=A0A7W3SZ48_9ACTN|nr:type I polyketide synthase [Streptomyces calidiresistens]MBB0227967.1 acyltransferase domain-containing protein [Streptomyces calidiresistens]